MADHSHDHHTSAEKHVHGTMDIAEHQKMFDSYVHFWVYVFGASAGILIFLAIFNS